MEWLIQILNSVQYGLLLFLVASGLTLVFGIMGVINLAHGSFYMIGAYLAFSLSQWTGSLWIALPLGVAIAAALGLALERTLIARLYRRDHLYQVLLTFGLILVFEELRSILVGDDVHSVAVPPVLAASLPLTENLSYPVYRLFISVVCLALAAAIYWTMQRTRLGMMIRAAASNPEMAQSLGIDIRWMHALVFAAGVALAAFAGIIAAPVSSVFPGMGNQVLIVCFVVVVIGGIGSLTGALVASLLIGFADTFGKVLMPELSGVAVYLLMAVVLLFRPAGLFGRAADHARETRSFRCLLIGVAALACFPLLAEQFYLQLVTKIMILSIFALSLDLLVGYAGLVSLGHAAYFGVAAYTLALTAPAGDPANVWITLPLALGASALCALIVGALVVRTAGVYFIMVTLAFAQMIYYFFHDTRLAGGSDGMYIDARPSIGIAGVDLASDVRFYYAVLVVLVCVFAMLAAILRSPFGRALQGIKANEQRMRALGYPTLRYKLAAFVVAGTLAGLAGYLAAAKEGFVNPELMAWQQSGVVLVMLILGGMGSLFGAVIGTFAYMLLQEWFSTLTRHWPLLMGAFIIAAVLLFPEGLADDCRARWWRAGVPAAGRHPSPRWRCLSRYSKRRA